MMVVPGGICVVPSTTTWLAAGLSTPTSSSALSPWLMMVNNTGTAAPMGLGTRLVGRVGNQHVAERDAVSDVAVGPVDGGNLAIGLGDLTRTTAHQRLRCGAAGHDANRSGDGGTHDQK